MRSLKSVRYFLLAFLLLVIPASSFAGVFVSVTIAPPVLPVYTQPPCPGDGYIWTPGYWGWGNGVYVWHAGYWGPHIGFYGGVNYGFGYFGSGYEGGYWRDRHFYYNRTVNNVTITNVHIYNKTVINQVTVNRVSYNGGRGGIAAHENREQERAEREHHFEMTDRQRDHEHKAGGNRAFLASENHGRPAVAATPRPAEFHGPHVMPARAGGNPYAHPATRPVPRAENNMRRDDRPMPREDMRNNRGPEPRHQPAPRPESRPESSGPHGNGGPHGDRGPRGNDGPHGNAPHGDREGHGDHGHDERH